MRKLCIVFIVIISCAQPLDMKSCFSSDEEQEETSKQSDLVDVHFPAGPENSAEPRDQTGSSWSRGDSEYAPLSGEAGVRLNPADTGGCVACICCLCNCLSIVMSGR